MRRIAEGQPARGASAGCPASINRRSPAGAFATVGAGAGALAARAAALGFGAIYVSEESGDAEGVAAFTEKRNPKFTGR